MTTRVEELEKRIEECNRKYWSGEESPLSDPEYDKLVRELEKLDPENPLVAKLAPVEIHGKKVVHEKPMLSLAKAYSIEEVLAWARKVARGKKEKLLVQPKYDGLSGLVDRKGVLSSRGDGRVGEDYSGKLPYIKFLGKPRKDGTWLGEILITDEDFELMRKVGVGSRSGTPFKNQRNAAAGIIGADDLEWHKDAKKRMGTEPLTFVDYQLHSWEVPLEKLEERWDALVEEIRGSGFPMDGIVVRLADEEYAESLGATEHHPKGAIAYKFTNQSAWTTLRKVNWSMGKDQLAAVGELDPIELGGVVVRNVKLQLTPSKQKGGVASCLVDGSLQVGDRVLVERAGDIIPHVVESKPGQKRERVVLERCPFCFGEVEVGESSIRCTNPKCRKKQVEKLKFALATLGWKGAGDAYAASLVEKLGVTSVEKLLQVEEKQLREFPEEFGDKLAENFLLEEARVRKQATPLQLLVAMDLPGVGGSVGKLLLEEVGLERILAGDVREAELRRIHGIGEVTAREAAEGIHDRLEEIQRTFALVEGKKEAGKKESRGEICFTGKMEQPRKVLEKWAEEAGWTPVDHVGKGLAFLVAADASSRSGKMQRAAKLGAKVISEAEFRKMVNK